MHRDPAAGKPGPTTRDTVLACIAEDTGQPVARVEEDSRRDRWLTAQEAVDYGFVDGFVDSLAALLPPHRTPIGLRGGR